MKENHIPLDEALKIISKDRDRTNIIRKYEQKTIAYLFQYVPLTHPE